MSYLCEITLVDNWSFTEYSPIVKRAFYKNKIQKINLPNYLGGASVLFAGESPSNMESVTKIFLPSDVRAADVEKTLCTSH